MRVCLWMGKHAMYKLNFLLMYVCIYITSSKKRKAFRKLVFRFSKIQVSKQNLFNSNANICISGKDVYLVLLLQGPPIQGYCFKILQTHKLLHTLFFSSNQLWNVSDLIFFRRSFIAVNIKYIEIADIKAGLVDLMLKLYKHKIN